MGHENVGIIAGPARSSSSCTASPRATASSSSTTSAATLRVVPPRRVPALRGHRLAHQPRRPPLRLHLLGQPRHLWGGFSAVHVPALERRPAQGARRRHGRARRPGHPAVQRHRVGALRRRGRLRQHRADPGPRPAGPLPGGRLQAGRRLARSSSPAPPATPPGWSWRKDLGADVGDRRPAGQDPLERVLELTGGKGVDVVLDCTVAGRHRAGAARHRRAQAPRGHDGHPGRAGRVPRLPGQEDDREGDHDQERPRPQLPGLRARAGAAGLRPLPAGAAGHPQLRPRATSTTRSAPWPATTGEDAIHISLLPWLGRDA